nr:SLBB domain-containing protein [Bacteroidota bacterium]
LVIPLVGEIKGLSKTLAAFRADVIAAIKQRYLQGDPTVSLVAPRRIVVRVRGKSVTEGSNIITAADRVQSLISLQPDPATISNRSIKIFRTHADPILVDLERYQATRDPRWSPYLQEGDEVVFRAATSDLPTVTVGGAVTLPSTFEWKEGDRLRDLLAFAKGLREYADPDSIQLIRALGKADWLQAASDEPVYPGDRIIVRSVHAPSGEGLISIEGEVRHPGLFPIMGRLTRLSEAIAMAGGVTHEAMVHGSSIYRTSVSARERRLFLLTFGRGNAALEDTTFVRLENEARLYGEPLSADVVRALAEPLSEADIVLLPGDRIIVPRRTGTVYVFGQVSRPGHVPFNSGARVEEYLRATGGLTARAKDDDVVVIKSASRQWLSPEDTTIEEGDMVWVPRVVERDLAYNMTLVGQVASIVSAAATLVLLMIQIGK